MTEFDKYCGCSKPVLNGCPSQTDLGCTYYTGDKLDPLNIDKGTNGNSIIKIINDYIKNVLERLEVPPTRISNIGNKVGIYKDLSDQFIHEFKSLSGIEGIIINNTNDYIEISVDTDWFKEHIIEVFETPLFQTFFINYLQNLFDSNLFNSYFSNYITNLIENGNIDICRLIKKCDLSHDYYIDGNVEYTVPNRVVNFNLIAQDFIDKYYDELGHSLVSVKITSGNLQGFMKGNGQPLQLNDIIPISEVNNITFTANNQSSPYTVSIGFVGINSNNEIVN